MVACHIGVVVFVWCGMKVECGGWNWKAVWVRVGFELGGPLGVQIPAAFTTGILFAPHPKKLLKL